MKKSTLITSLSAVTAVGLSLAALRHRSRGDRLQAAVASIEDTSRQRAQAEQEILHARARGRALFAFVAGMLFSALAVVLLLLLAFGVISPSAVIAVPVVIGPALLIYAAQARRDAAGLR